MEIPMKVSFGVPTAPITERIPLMTATEVPENGGIVLATQTPVGEAVVTPVAGATPPIEVFGTPDAPTIGDNIYTADWGRTDSGTELRLHALSNSQVRRLGLHLPKGNSEYGGADAIFKNTNEQTGEVTYWIANKNSRYDDGLLHINGIYPEESGGRNQRNP